MVYGSAVENCYVNQNTIPTPEILFEETETVKDLDIDHYYQSKKDRKPFEKYRIVFHGNKAKEIPITIFIHSRKEPKKGDVFVINTPNHNGKVSTLRKTKIKYPSFLKEKWKVILVIDGKVHVY